MNGDVDPLLDRRGLLSWSARGLGATALTSLLLRDGVLAAEPTHFPPRVRRAIQICLIGGLSHVDSFDFKPALTRLHGRTLQMREQPDLFFGQIGLLRKNDWEFRKRGQSGLWMSDLFPHLAEQADELTIINSMATDSANHTPALYFENCGFGQSGFPSLGSWFSFGLGNEAEDLPTYVVLPDSRGQPNGGSSIWSNGFLPSEHQGVLFRSGSSPVRDLFPARPMTAATEADSRDLLRRINEMHAQRSGGDSVLAARMRSYELAARMQLSVPEVADLGRESAATQAMYGLDRPETAEFGRNCLLGRRLLERGVRFVQIFSGGPIAGSPRASWDAHENVRENHGLEARRVDLPVAALLKDLRRRGLLDDTLVMFTTEFGRTPFTQSAAGTVGQGRDHNKYGFSVWLAGGGLKSGTVYGATDEVGWKAAENEATWHDFHATVLRLFGIDHERLTYYHNGIRRRLTNVHGHAMENILA